MLLASTLDPLALISRLAQYSRDDGQGTSLLGRGNGPVLMGVPSVQFKSWSETEAAFYFHHDTDRSQIPRATQVA